MGRIIELLRSIGAHFLWVGDDERELDPYLMTAEPQLTALTIVRRLAERDPETFGPKQHSIVQRLLKALRKVAAERLLASTAPSATSTNNQLPVLWTARTMMDPPTGPTGPVNRHFH